MFPQAIYKRHEFAEVADFLMSHQTALRDEFMKGHSSLKDAIAEYGYPSMDKTHIGKPLGLTGGYVRTIDETGSLKTNVKAWNSVTFRGTITSYDTGFTLPPDHPIALRYPTAYKMVTGFGEICGAGQFSSFAPRTVLTRHTDPEDRESRFLRIHIPLIIPRGDVFIEVNGEKIEWTDIFGFNNQLSHSAYNNTSEYKLIFLIDIDREYLGISKGRPWDIRWEKFAKPFR